MSVTSTDTVVATPVGKPIRSLGSSLGTLSPGRHHDSQIKAAYKQASQLFLQRDFTDSLAVLQPILTVPQQSGDDATAGEEDERLAPIAAASRSYRIKIWSLYLTLLNAIIELGPEDGKVALGSKQWRDITAKAWDGSIWDEVVRIGYGGIEGNVDADVVFNLANLLLSQPASQTTNQQHLETYLATSDVARTPRPDQPTPNDTNNLRNLASRIKILELYILHVLPANEEWDYAHEFVQMSDILDDERKEAFQQALEGLAAAKTQNHQQRHEEEHEEDPTEDLQPAEPKPIEDHEHHPTEHRRSNSEQDYGIEAARKTRKTAKPEIQPASNKPNKHHNPKPNPSKVSSRRPPTNHGIIQRSMAFVTAFQNLISSMTQSMSKKNPLALLRFLLFVVALLVALSRRDVKERLKKITSDGWEKVKSTVGMGVSVSYI
ncbi:MAG: hypothetical protein L6R39_007667 [Caloplaca ligustica]|nr:MAG: hypothetical protein L6R39_007667 [Caloplaca ligustica]